MPFFDGESDGVAPLLVPAFHFELYKGVVYTPAAGCSRIVGDIRIVFCREAVCDNLTDNNGTILSNRNLSIRGINTAVSRPVRLRIF